MNVIYTNVGSTGSSDCDNYIDTVFFMVCLFYFVGV